MNDIGPLSRRATTQSAMRRASAVGCTAPNSAAVSIGGATGGGLPMSGEMGVTPGGIDAASGAGAARSSRIAITRSASRRCSASASGRGWIGAMPVAKWIATMASTPVTGPTTPMTSRSRNRRARRWTKPSSL